MANDRDRGGQTSGRVRLAPLQRPARASGAARPLALRTTTHAATAQYFHDSGVRGMLHDMASEIALMQPANPRKYLYDKLRPEFAAEEQAEGEHGERVQALDEQTDWLRVQTECGIGGRVKRALFVQRAPPLPCPQRARGITPAAQVRFASWGRDALAAVTSVVHDTAGLEAAEPESARCTSDRFCRLLACLGQHLPLWHTFAYALIISVRKDRHACAHTHALRTPHTRDTGTNGSQGMRQTATERWIVHRRPAPERRS